MNAEQLLRELKALGDPRALQVWQRMGMDTRNFYGVGLTKIRTLAKKIKKDHTLAAALWQSGIHDARLLAAFIAEPAKVTEEQLERWVAEADFWDLSDKLATEVVAKSPYARKKMSEWLPSKQEYVRRAAFVLLAELARSDNELKDDELQAYLARIEKDIHREQNWVREAMNTALIAIGSRNQKLNQKARAAAKRIGQVEVDYGDTSCRLPDALAHLTSKKLQARLK